MSSFLEIFCHTFPVQIWPTFYVYKPVFDRTSSMSSSIYDGVKDGVLFAIFAAYQMIIMVKFDLSSKIADTMGSLSV